MLHSRRQRLAKIAEGEANGESFWISTFDDRVRRRTLQWFERGITSTQSRRDHFETARRLILHEEGLQDLGFSVYPSSDMEQFLLGGPQEMVPTAIEALTAPLRYQALALFTEHVNLVLREDRVSWELIGGEMIPFESREMHESIVRPVLSLLGNRPDLDKVETAYGAALAEIANGNPADAITDAGTALQETLVGIGAQGNALGPLISSAKKLNLFAGHDSTLLKSLEGALHWASADRSEKGDAHHTSDADVQDAWLTVHIVGALILRLTKGPPRA